MRFSSIFRPQDPAPRQPQAGGGMPVWPARKDAPVTAPPPADLPEDLDARVRLIGEWQLGEG
jgi:hypothetical protein